MRHIHEACKEKNIGGQMEQSFSQSLRVRFGGGDGYCCASYLTLRILPVPALYSTTIFHGRCVSCVRREVPDLVRGSSAGSQHKWKRNR